MGVTEDEFGTKWLVKPGDPASNLINTLSRKGFDIIVLPRYTYICGEFKAPDFEPGDVLKAARMADCIGVLFDQ